MLAARHGGGTQGSLVQRERLPRVAVWPIDPVIPVCRVIGCDKSYMSIRKSFPRRWYCITVTAVVKACRAMDNEYTSGVGRTEDSYQRGCNITCSTLFAQPLTGFGGNFLLLNPIFRAYETGLWGIITFLFDNGFVRYSTISSVAAQRQLVKLVVKGIAWESEDVKTTHS
jgi:hypothetical protein